MKIEIDFGGLTPQQRIAQAEFAIAAMNGILGKQSSTELDKAASLAAAWRHVCGALSTYYPQWHNGVEQACDTIAAMGAQAGEAIRAMAAEIKTLRNVQTTHGGSAVISSVHVDGKPSGVAQAVATTDAVLNRAAALAAEDDPSVGADEPAETPAAPLDVGAVFASAAGVATVAPLPGQVEGSAVRPPSTLTDAEVAAMRGTAPVAPPVAPPAAPPAADGPELDAKQTPWSARIHSDTKGKNKDGTWRYRRNMTDAQKAEIPTIEAELRASVGAPPAPPPPVPAVPAVPAVPPVPPIMPPVPPEVPPAPGPASAPPSADAQGRLTLSGMGPHAALALAVGQALNLKLMTPEQRDAGAKAVGLESFAMIVARPDLADALRAEYVRMGVLS